MIERLGDRLGDDTIVLFVIFLIVGYIGIYIFGFGDYVFDGTHFWQEPGCFAELFTIGLLLTGTYFLFGPTDMGYLLIILVIYWIIKH